MTSYYLYTAAPFLVLIGIAVYFGLVEWKRRTREKENLRGIARTLGFTFAEPETGNRFVRMFGLQDVTTGNEELDRRVVVKGVPNHVVQRIVSHGKLQRELVRLFEHDGLIHVDLHGAHYRQSSSFSDEQKLRPLLDAMTRTVSALEKAT